MNKNYVDAWSAKISIAAIIQTKRQTNKQRQRQNKTSVINFVKPYAN